jgi:HrpA-like RNA helicase
MQVETRGAPEEKPSPFKLEYDPALPITAHRAEVIEAIRRNPAIVLCGATGSGKSTQLPKLCLEAGRGVAGVIGHTQPRRIAARALANRLAEETGTTVGGAIGYKVRFNDRTGPDCRIKLMTDGILLKELESDRKLRRYDTLIIDEAHERSLNIDLLLGVLKQMLPQRPDLRLIVTSATIDPARFAEFFGSGGQSVPIIEVSGRSYPVEVRYRPLSTPRDEEQNDEDVADAAELSLPEGIIEAIRDLDAPRRGSGFGQGSRGDVLVFLPGEKHIREAADALVKERLPNTEVLPLFARLSGADQERIFQRHGQRRIVLATNVAETSLTVPGIRFVIDSGLARISRYSVRGKVQRLPIERVSKASADQRKGRCGREAEGICIRLYSEEDFTLREDFTPPEVLRTNLASVILRMATLGLGDPESFPFLDPPDTRLVNDGVRLLQELKAMDDERRVTSLGQQIAGIPVDPRLGRMLLAAARQRCLTEMLIVASFLEGQDPRERPSDAQQQASEKHALFADARSDFITVLNIWRAYNEQSAALSRNQLRKWCKEHFLSYLRIREWQDLHSQLSQSLNELKLRPNQEPASYTDLHQAILTGFLGSIGELDEKREYNGPRGMRFVIAPGTPLASKPPRWVVAGSIVETTKLYARMVAAVDPGWIEAAGAHLLKRTYTEPHWEAARGYVSAYETVALYGLTLASRRRINYGAIAPAEARDLFIRHALVDTSLDGRALADDYVVAAGGSGGGDRGGGGGAAARGVTDSSGQGLTAADLNAAMAERSDANAARREQGVGGGQHAGREQGAARNGATTERVDPAARRAEANAARHGGGNSNSRHRERASIQGEFLQANGRLRAEIEGLEAKIRRRDVVVDEEHQVDFYRSRLPERVNSVAAFNHWRAEVERTNPRLLYMSRADLTQRDAQEAGAERFPDELPVGGNQLPLLYKFEPAEPADGVTLVVPELLLDVVSAEQIAWLVPGMRLEKITTLFRALPKAQRKLLVPVPDFAKAALDDLEAETARLGRLPAFHEWLAQWITQRVGSTITPSELVSLPLPDYLRMNLRVLDADDRVLAEGRDLLAIKRKLYATAPAVVAAAAAVTNVSRGAAAPLRGSSGGVRDSRERAGSHAAAGPKGNLDAPPRGQASDRARAIATEGAHAGGREGAGATATAQPGTGADASSMAEALASAWGASRPTHGARAGAGARGGDATADALASARGASRPTPEARAGASDKGGGDAVADALSSGRGASSPTPEARAGAGGKGGRDAMADAPSSGRGASRATPGTRAGAGARGGDAMADALASAWGASRPTPGARAGAGARGGDTGAGPRADSNARPAATVARTDGGATHPRAALVSSPAVDAPLHRQWDFGDVPEHRDVERNRLRLVVYPAIEDRGTGVALVEARNAPTAEVILRAGIVRLAMLALPQQAKFVSKRVTDDRDLVLLSRGLPLRQSLADALTQRAFRECFLPVDAPVPRTAQDFNKVLDARRAQLSEAADRLATTITLTLKELRAARAALDGLRPGAFPDVVAEVNAQLGLLLPPDFIESTPRPWLDYLPRYLKAVTRRIERLPPNIRRDAELAAKVKPFAAALRAFMAEPVISSVRPELEELRWMIEEFRVSLFAQELKTMIRVSEKRLDDQVRLVRESQR